MRNPSVDALKSGFYLIRIDDWVGAMAEAVELDGAMDDVVLLGIEKTEDGTVYQLRPATGERDGVMRGDRWLHDRDVRALRVWAPER